MSLPKRVALLVLGVGMMAIGSLHFLVPAPFVRIVPSWLPNAHLVVLVSGACEIAAGVLLLLPATRRLAALGLAALYAAVFPANLNMALHHIQLFPGGTIPVWQMWARLPLQAVLIAWALWFARREASAPAARL